MFEVLASLKPYYYYLIGEGIKKIEIRKSAIKAKNWNHKVNFYMSKDDKSFAKIPKQFQEKYRTHFGKVGLEVECHHVYDLSYVPNEYIKMPQGTWETIVCENACLSLEELEKYSGGKRIFGWYVDQVGLLDNPRNLSEFNLPCPKNVSCINCEYTSFDENYEFYCRAIHIERPPQSYCYVEAYEKENSIFRC